jgi:BASS family bile acid:Na+ symporter
MGMAITPDQAEALNQHGFSGWIRRFGFTVAIFAVVVAAMLFPAPFRSVHGFPLQRLIVPLLQIIMLGVGCTMSWHDLARVLRMPRAVLAGVLCHYAIMPLVAVTLAHLFRFPPEIAAGVVLVGCCPSGLASNVIALLAKANVPLSVTVTTISTLIAPIATPLLMKALGGGFIQIDAMAMFLDMVKLVLLPVCVGATLNRLFGVRAGVVLRVMPSLSMTGIALIIAVITAAGRDNLLHVGSMLLVAVTLQMLAGFGIGYAMASLFRLKEADCRTISIEVGMQNSGLASGIALGMGRIATMGLAAVINGPVMNVIFSLVGTWWSNRPPCDEVSSIS